MIQDASHSNRTIGWSGKRSANTSLRAAHHQRTVGHVRGACAGAAAAAWRGMIDTHVATVSYSTVQL